MILTGTRSVIFSQVLGAGRSRSTSPAGPRASRSGPVRRRASRSRTRGSAKAPKTPGTSGRSSTGSSASANLTRSLANRLQALLGTDGSMEYRQTWKEKTTPAGRLYWAHTASGRPTSGRDCTGWPTVMAGTPAQKGYHEAGNTDDLPGLAGWSAPRAEERCQRNSRDAGVAPSKMAGWATCAARDWRSDRGRKSNLEQYGKKGMPLPRMALLTPGAKAPGSCARTAKHGALNPEFCRWLTGYPDAWGSSGATAMRSCRRRQPRS